MVNLEHAFSEILSSMENHCTTVNPRVFPLSSLWEGEYTLFSKNIYPESSDNSGSPNKYLVSLQEEETPKRFLSLTAAALWHKSRNLVAMAKGTAAQARCLDNLNQDGVITLWAAGLEPLPSYCLEDPTLNTAIVEIRKKAALEIQDRTSRHLHQRSEQYMAHSSKVLAKAEEISSNDPQVIPSAVQTSATKIGRGKVKLIRDLSKKKAHLSHCQLTEADWPQLRASHNRETPSEKAQSAATWDGGASNFAPEYDSSFAGNPGTLPLSFKKTTGRPSRPNISQEFEGALEENKNREVSPKKAHKVQFRNPTSDPPSHLQNSQASSDNTRQSLGRMGKPRRGRGGRRFERDSRDRYPSRQQNPRRGRGRGRPQGDPDSQLTENE